MTKAKWNERCWNCGSRNMAMLEDYALCEDCGATATPPVCVGVIPILYSTKEDVHAYHVQDVSGNSPSPALARKIALERSQKTAQGVKR